MQNQTLLRRAALAVLFLAVVIGLLVYGLGVETIKARQVDLVYLGQ